MAENSKITWTHATMNPWRGCTRVSPACDHCYAETMSGRNPSVLGTWGPDGTRVVAAESYWREPLKWDRNAKDGVCLKCRGRGTVVRAWHEIVNGEPEQRSEKQPCQACNNGRIAPYRLRVFCASLADVFEDWRGHMIDTNGKRLWVSRCVPAGDVPAWFPETPQGDFSQCRPLTMSDVRRRLFHLICWTPNLDWLLLTKRPENALTMMVEAGLYAVANPKLPRPQPNIWFGATVEDQARADERREHLRSVPAAVKFVSYEPALGPVDWSGWEFIDWLIIAGESGAGARPSHPDWFRSARDWCQANGVACHFKQWGEWCPDADVFADIGRDNLSLSTRRNLPINVILNTPGHGWPTMARVGKKAAGRLLDGQLWDEFPEPTP
jgi:protein gp37